MSYDTLLPCYIALLAWHPTCSLGQKLQRVKPWQTMIPWHLLLCLFYMCISVWNVTLSVPCYRTRARVITFLPVFLWRVTICPLSNNCQWVYSVLLDFSETRECLFLKPRGRKCSFVGKKSCNVCFEGRSSWLVLHRDSSQATHKTGKPKQGVLFKKLDFEGIRVNQRCSWRIH